MIKFLNEMNVGTEIIRTVLGACEVDLDNIVRIDNAIWCAETNTGRKIKICLTNDNKGATFLIADENDELSSALSEFSIMDSQYGFIMNGIAYTPYGKTVYLRSDFNGYLICSSYNTADIVKSKEEYDKMTDEIDKITIVFNTTDVENKSLNVPSQTTYLPYETLEDLSNVVRDFYFDPDTYTKMFGSGTLTF